MVSIYTDEEKKQKIIDTLSKDYIDSNEITIDNIGDYVQIVEQELLFAPVNIKSFRKTDSTVDENVITYAVEGIAVNTDYELVSELNLIVNIDYNNNTFSIEPTETQYDDIEIIPNIASIEKNDNNKYSTGKVSMENTAKDYVNNYKKIVLAKPEVIYNHMSEEYREKRFENLENFQKYVENNREEIRNIDLTQYLFNSLENCGEYVGKDQYGNLYIFKEKEVMDYTIELDDYTLDYDDEEFVKEYNSSTDQYKVANNINKIVKMINNRDYLSIYNVLDENFRETEFGSIETFEDYMREAFPKHYEVNYEDFDKEDDEIYSQSVILTEIMIRDEDYEYTQGDEGDRVEKTILMKLEDNTNFAMSFNITKADL